METEIPSGCVKYGNPDADTVLLQIVDKRDLENMEEEVKELSAASDRPYLMLCYPVEDWNRDLSPWPAAPVFGRDPFSGGAERTLDNLRKHVLPAFCGKAVFLGGYSLAGLFSLWAAYQTAGFSSVCAASPSVWYPGWTEYAASHIPRTERIYLSLGDREERAKNRVLATVGDCIRAQYALLAEQGILSVLEWNPGNHFQDAEKRTAKGFAWLLNHS
jgi:predicted alpha/beta superfamily hydrolase